MLITPIHLHQIRRPNDRIFDFGIHPYFFTKDLLKTFSCFPNIINLSVPTSLQKQLQASCATAAAFCTAASTYNITFWLKQPKNSANCNKFFWVNVELEKKTRCPKLRWYTFSYPCRPLQPKLHRRLWTVWHWGWESYLWPVNGRRLAVKE